MDQLDYNKGGRPKSSTRAKCTACNRMYDARVAHAKRNHESSCPGGVCGACHQCVTNVRIHRGRCPVLFNRTCSVKLSDIDEYTLENSCTCTLCDTTFTTTLNGTRHALRQWKGGLLCNACVTDEECDRDTREVWTRVSTLLTQQKRAMCSMCAVDIIAQKHCIDFTRGDSAWADVDDITTRIERGDEWLDIVHRIGAYAVVCAPCASLVNAADELGHFPELRRLYAESELAAGTETAPAATTEAQMLESSRHVSDPIDDDWMGKGRERAAVPAWCEHVKSRYTTWINATVEVLKSRRVSPKRKCDSLVVNDSIELAPPLAKRRRIVNTPSKD